MGMLEHLSGLVRIMMLGQSGHGDRDLTIRSKRLKMKFYVLLGSKNLSGTLLPELKSPLSAPRSSQRM